MGKCTAPGQVNRRARRGVYLVQEVRRPKDRRRAPLQRLQQVRVEDGSSLPVDRQLRRLPDPKALHTVPLLCDGNVLLLDHSVLFARLEAGHVPHLSSVTYAFGVAFQARAAHVLLDRCAEERVLGRG